jgi:gamma-glutamyltranspeptidase/glutathione hydrolase
MGILERGGNAFDAAVATAFTLQVVEPHLNGPGGDAPIIVYDVRRGRPEVICGQGPAPAGATLEHYRSLGLDMVPGTGLLAACIPGPFDAFMLMLRDYGTMRLRDVLAPAIFYAREGYPLVERIPATIATVEELFRQHWTTSAHLYLPGGRIPEEGEIFANPALAATYERILTEAESGGGGREAEIGRARNVWSQGFVAEAIDRFCRTHEVMDTSGERHRGVLTGQDMAGWEATIEPPISYDYGRYTVLKCGPWTQGLATLQQLALLSGFGLDGLDPTGPDFIHLQVEAAKLAFADRDTFYGDPDFVDVPVEELLSARYNEERRRLITDRASMELRPGTIPGFGKVLGDRAGGERVAVGASGAGEPTVGRITRPPSGGGAGARNLEKVGAVRATRSISTSSTGTATWCPARLRAVGSNPRRSSRSSASRSARGRRCSGWTRSTRPRSRPASGPARRCRPPWRSGTASRTLPGAHRAAISRTSGSRNSFCGTSMRA